MGTRKLCWSHIGEKKTHLKARYRQNYLQVLSFWARWDFKCFQSTKWVRTNYINVLYVQQLIWDHDNFARVTSQPKTHLKARFRQTCYNDLVFERGESLSVFGAQNESVRIILMYYIFNKWFGITKTLLESLRSQNTHFRARFRQTSFKDLIFARGKFLSVVGAQNESPRLIIIYCIKIHI